MTEALYESIDYLLPDAAFTGVEVSAALELPGPPLFFQSSLAIDLGL